MEIIIKAESKEIADIAERLQSQPNSDKQESAISISKMIDRYGKPPKKIRIDHGNV